MRKSQEVSTGYHCYFLCDKHFKTEPASDISTPIPQSCLLGPKIWELDRVTNRTRTEHCHCHRVVLDVHVCALHVTIAVVKCWKMKPVVVNESTTQNKLNMFDSKWLL